MCKILICYLAESLTFLIAFVSGNSICPAWFTRAICDWAPRRSGSPHHVSLKDPELRCHQLSTQSRGRASKRLGRHMVKQSLAPSVQNGTPGLQLSLTLGNGRSLAFHDQVGIEHVTSMLPGHSSAFAAVCRPPAICLSQILIGTALVKIFEAGW